MGRMEGCGAISLVIDFPSFDQLSAVSFTPSDTPSVRRALERLSRPLFRLVAILSGSALPLGALCHLFIRKIRETRELHRLRNQIRIPALTPMSLVSSSWEM